MVVTVEESSYRITRLDITTSVCTFCFGANSVQDKTVCNLAQNDRSQHFSNKYLCGRVPFQSSVRHIDHLFLVVRLFFIVGYNESIDGLLIILGAMESNM